MVAKSTEVKTALGLRYPSAVLTVLDREYETVSHEWIQKRLRSFHRWMRAMRLIRWRREVLDCDDWSLAFKTYCALLQARDARSSASVFLGVMTFYKSGSDGMPYGHMINCYAVLEEVIQVYEVDPDPNAGSYELTTKELDTAWMVML